LGLERMSMSWLTVVRAREVIMKWLGILGFVLTFTIAASSQAKYKSVLTGTVYDAQGSVVVKAKVRAVDVRGNKFETVTNEEGDYVLTLPFNKYDQTRGFKESKYDIFVESLGFKRSETKGYVFIPVHSGKMHLDIGLEIGAVSVEEHP
jgi:hypothetical protein